MGSHAGEPFPGCGYYSGMISDLVVADGAIRGVASLRWRDADHQVPVTFDDESIPTLKVAQRMLQKIESALAKVDLGDLMHNVAVEVTDCCYSQSDYQPTAADYQQMAAELVVTHLNLGKRDAVITLDSPTCLPDFDVCCVVTYRTGRITEVTIHTR